MNKMKNKKLVSMFMMMLMITLPVAYAQIIKADLGGQARDIGNELERKLTEEPTLSDIIGEDIIINVKEYQPAILRTGLLEDQGALVYAILSGTPSNPAIKIPKIHDVDILSYNVVTVPEGLPVRIGKPRYFRDRTQALSYDNMGYLQIPIARIAKESNVPDELIIEVEARVLFDVSSGLGKSPTKMVIRQKSSTQRNNENQKYLNIYIEAEEISSDYAIFDVFDNNGNLIEDDLKIDKGKKSPTIRRNRFYSPGQVFDKFNIYLKDVKSQGKTLDIMVIRDGVPETHTISEGESIYPGSGIILKDIESQSVRVNNENREKISANFLSPNRVTKTASFIIEAEREVVVDPVEGITLVDQLTTGVEDFSKWWTSLGQSSTYSIEQLYELSAEEYGVAASLINGDMTLEFPGITSPKETSIPEFYAQYNRALITRVNIKDPVRALDEYKKLLSLVQSYSGNQKLEAESVISIFKINRAINILSGQMGSSLTAEITVQEENGEEVFIIIEGSSLIESKSNSNPSIATVSVVGQNRNDPITHKPLQEGEVLPNSNNQWFIKKITSTSIILGSYNNGQKDIPVPKKSQQGIDIPIIMNNDPKQKASIRVVLEGTELHNEAHIIVSPNIEKAFSAARFNLHIPIEKRALDLPLFSESIESEIDKTERLIESLDRTLEKVGKIHEAWKKFCFGVYTAIAAWNFLKSSVGSGAGKAKDRASEVFWEKHGTECNSQGKSMDECVFANEASYDSILKNAESAYEEAAKVKVDEFVGDFKVTEENKVQMEQLEYSRSMAKSNPGDTTLSKDYITKLTKAKLDKIKKDKLNEAVRKNNGEPLSVEEESKLQIEILNSEIEMYDQLETDNANSPEEIRRHISSLSGSSYSTDVSLENQIYNKRLTAFDSSSPTNQKLKDQIVEDMARLKLGTISREVSLLGLLPEKRIETEQEAVDAAIEEIKEAKYAVASSGSLILFSSKTNGESLYSPDGKKYTLTDKPIEQRAEHIPKVTYYTEGPNKGKVHRITIDAINYAEYEYTSGGMMKEPPQIFSRPEPNAEIRADNTEQANSGLNDAGKLRTAELCTKTINKAKASNAKNVICDQVNYAIRNDPITKGVSCVDFYSPTQCKLLFNACDPVLCPSSRFDMNGAYRVENVVETGIIGSTILGLHNFGIPGTDFNYKGGQVVMPICITGIYAGLQNIQTVLMEYSDCLKRSLVDDESVGICDMLRSYYICDVLWKEAITIFNIKSGVVGSILKSWNDDEGSEYTDFDASMDQSINGLKYFTQDYAKNTFAQFSGGSLPEIGGEVCKAAVFGKVPGVGSFTDRLMQPESPPQFTATMDTVPYSDIPFPPQSTYKVYYRMYAGANEPLSFSVYMKYQGIAGQSGLPIAWLVRNKRLDLNAFDSENVDFVGPEGYNQVCVAYSSPTYGVREECGFGKTSSGFAMNYVAQQMAKKEAGQGEIQTAEQCNPSGASLSGPYTSVPGKVGAVAVGGFSSGLLDTGITRVCSTVVPGDEKDWKAVGQCWEGDKANEGRNLGLCYLYLPSAKDVVTKYSANQDAAWKDFEGEIPGAEQIDIDRIKEYADSIGIDKVYFTDEDIDEDIKKAKEHINKKEWKHAETIYRKILQSQGLIERVKEVEIRLNLAYMYGQWARDIVKKQPKNNPLKKTNADNNIQLLNDYLEVIAKLTSEANSFNDFLKEESIKNPLTEQGLSLQVDCNDQTAGYVRTHNSMNDESEGVKKSIEEAESIIYERIDFSNYQSCLEMYHKEYPETHRTNLFDEELNVPSYIKEVDTNTELLKVSIEQPNLVRQTNCLTDETELVPITNFQEIIVHAEKAKASYEQLMPLIRRESVQSCLAPYVRKREPINKELRLNQ